MTRTRLLTCTLFVALIFGKTALAGEITGTITPVASGINVQVEISSKTYSSVTDALGQFVIIVKERGAGILKIKYKDQWTEGITVQSRDGTSRYDLSIEEQCVYTLKRD
jgi:VCBS repeat-containing protein